MKSRQYLYFFFFTLSLLIVFILFWTNEYFYIFIIKTFPEEQIIFQKKISPDEEFALVYVHSVAQTPVWEFFKFDNNGKMILTETHFYDHGAGLPYTSFGEEIFITENNKFKIKNMYREISLPLYYRVYRDRENIMIYKNQEINLSKIIGDRLLFIDINRINKLTFFLNNIKKYYFFGGNQ